MFLGVGVGRVFFGAVLPMLLLYYSVFRSRKCLEKILLMSGLVFLGFFSLLLWFFSPTSSPFFVFFFFSFLREKAQVVTGHTPTRTLCFFLFLVFVPPQPGLLCSPVLAVCPSFSRFVGVPFWAPGVLATLWILSVLGGA